LCPAVVADGDAADELRARTLADDVPELQEPGACLYRQFLGRGQLVLGGIGVARTLAGREGQRQRQDGQQGQDLLQVRHRFVLLLRTLMTEAREVFQRGARSYTTRPPSTVRSTRVCLIRSGGIRSRSWSSSTRSAYLPGVIDPVRSSMNAA